MARRRHIVRLAMFAAFLLVLFYLVAVQRVVNVDEVRALEAAGLRRGVTAARALGYAQVLEALDAGGDGQEAREPTFVGTRRYVRRQRSWFRRDHRVHWRDGAVDDLLSTTVAAWRHVS